MEGVAGRAPQHHPSCNHVAQLQRLLVQQQQVGVTPARNLRPKNADTSETKDQGIGAFASIPYHISFRFRQSTHIAAGGGTHGARLAAQLAMPCAWLCGAPAPCARASGARQGWR